MAIARAVQPIVPKPPMVEVRCRACGRLICKADTNGGRIEVVCPDRRCRRMQTLMLPKSQAS